MQESLDEFEDRIEACLIRDRHSLRRRLQGLHRRLGERRPIDRELEQLAAEIEQSSARLRARRERLPVPTFPAELPINQRREQIAAAIREHRVVVVCGETGSGKTTQLPKICLSLGLGAAGMIGHTQPRRIAARSVAARIAEELNTQAGQLVGYKVRFSDRAGPDSAIKLMTDGILLAETQGDRYLEQYEALIVDEAHERSLNIDFLLGYLRRLLPKRPDLKVIITSATIDPARFSQHFDNAPIIEVSGRTYPVELRYRPLAGGDEDQRDRDMQQAILDAVDEVFAIGPGDCLVFLSGEREIRETAESLRKHHPPDTEILPLYARLSASEQNKVFQAHQKKRIVLATNVAETSLTVPGIRYVIDPGYARISRYSHRSKVQRLPVEAISQAAARQRAGRCGRIGAGVCIRLYAEEDFQSRPAFTDPEILRTNLAAVILQMSALNLGEIEDFPFIDSPDSRLIADGFRLLFELGAVDERRRITKLGRQLARLPIDPRLARMLLAARERGCLKETLIVASALAIQDPRERPLDRQQAADEKHRRFHDQRSDFAALLNLWDYYQNASRHRSGSQMRKLCREDFLSFVRMREWRDLHQQLKSLSAEMGMRINDTPADYDSLHRASLAGLLGHIGMKQEDGAYLGARNRKFHIFPGSGLFKSKPKWVMAAELVETTRLYGRTVAKINPDWIEGLAGHLVKRSYSDPHWEKRPAQVAARETVTLYGLPIVVERRINYGPVAPAEAREIFIRRALVEGDFHCSAAFFKHNRELIESIEELEQKGRRRDVLADEETLFHFYDERIPEGIYSGPDFHRWLKKAQRADPELLFMTQDLLMAHEAAEVTGERFPDHLDLNGLRLPLVYRFEPGKPDDGVTVIVPLAALNQVDSQRLEWLVPGLLAHRVTALLKSLPKALRRHFVPAPDYARALLEVLKPDAVSLTAAMANRLFEITGVDIPADAWKPETVPEHLRMNVRVVDAEGRTLVEGRDLELIKEGLKGRARESFEALPTPEYERDEVKDWDFGELPEEVEFTRNHIKLKGYPALVAQPDRSVALRLLDRREDAEAATRLGLRRLFALRARDSIKYLQRNLPGLQQMSLHSIGVGTQEELREDLIGAIIDRVFLGDDPLPRNREAFEQRLARGRRQLPGAANEICALIRETLAAYHEIRKLLSGEMPLSRQEAAADIREQLDRLIYKGFVANTPPEWRRHLPRYLKAIGLRLKKLEQAPDKDRLRRTDIDALWRRFEDQYEKNQVRGVRDPELERFRWMLEELRVSVFAQELGTAFPVSVKRLEAQWAKLRG